MTETTLRPKQQDVPALPEFPRVYQDEAVYVFRVLRRLGVREADLEDLVHDVFLRAYRSWHTFDPARAMRPWLFGIAYRVMLDHQRKASTHAEVPTAELPEGNDEGADPHERLKRTQGLSLASKIVHGLELDRRAVFVMHELEEMPIPRVAEVLEIPLNTAYSRLRLARADFAKAAQALEVSRGN